MNSRGVRINNTVFNLSFEINGFTMLFRIREEYRYPFVKKEYVRNKTKLAIYRKKKKREFAEVRKHNLSIPRILNYTDNIAAKKNRSCDQSVKNCPFIGSKMLRVQKRKIKLDVGVRNKCTTQCCSMSW